MPPTPPAGPPPKKAPSNLRLRVIWASLAAALLIACTFGGPVSFGLFFAAVQAVMLKEFYRIMRASGYRPASWVGGITGVAIFVVVNFLAGWLVYGEMLHLRMDTTMYPPLSRFPQAISGFSRLYDVVVLLSSVFIWMGVAILVLVVLTLREIVLWPNHGQPFLNIGVTLTGLLYVSLPMALLSVIAYGSGHFEPGRVFLLILFIWAADTGAYFAGKNFGKHKLAPSISPGKTWEGWAGGAALTLATGWAAGYFLPDIPLSHRLVAAGVVAVFGPLGDLAESMLKRSAGVKDSGTFLPGHGGLLDRFDAFLLVLPVLALLQALIG